MTSFLWVLFGHYIGDFALQSQWQSENKGKNWYILFTHCMVYTACTCVALAYTGHYQFWKAMVILYSHAVIDMYRIKLSKGKDNQFLFLLDQFIHVFILALVDGLS